MSSDDEGLEPAVIDNGTWMCKAGGAGEKTARVYERTVIGRSRNQPERPPSGSGEFVGTAAMEPRDALDVTCPMERGAVSDWDDLTKLWEFIFTRELKGGVKGRPMLITEVPHNSKKNREKMIEVLFETFAVAGLYIAVPADLALYSSGRTTGLVLDVGGAVTHASAIVNCEDHLKKQTTHSSSTSLPVCNRVDVGGNDVTERLCQIVDARHGTAFSSNIGSQSHIEDLKHYLTGHFSANHRPSSADQHYKLPDGVAVTIDQEILDCYRVLFDQDDKTGAGDAKGVDAMLCDVLKSCDPDFQKVLLQSVVISGGTTFTPGIVQQVQASLEPLACLVSTEACVIAPPERRKSTWLGGSVLASLSEFPAYCKSKQDYSEHGAAYFHNYCNADILGKYEDT